MAQVLEAEKLLLMIYESDRLRAPICMEKVNPYVYLMRARYEVPLYYRFRFNPLPYSEELVDDLESLKIAGHITYSSPIEITQKGVARIEKKLIDFLHLSEAIGRALGEMSKWDDKLLFKAVYDTITR